MESGTIRIEKTFPQLTPSCCPNKVYAILFDQNGNGLKLSSGIYSLASYTLASHASFCLAMTEDSQRVLNYSFVINKQNLSLGKTPDGEYYEIEYWRRTQTNSSWNREEDTLLETEKVWWNGQYLSISRLEPDSLSSLELYSPHVQISYDSENSISKVVCWLEKLGRLHDSPRRCEVNWVKLDGTQIASITLTRFVSGMKGVYYGQLNAVELEPDDCTVVLVSITDSTGIVHSSVSSVISWD